MIIMDASEVEMEGFMWQVQQEFKQRTVKKPVGYNRDSLIEMTPRGEEGDGYDTYRSTQLRLTGFKPKALEFVSPLKQQSPNFASASTKDASGLGKGTHQTFGLSQCMFKCDEANGPESSPEVEFDQANKENVNFKA